jgi:hypothetical protein
MMQNVDVAVNESWNNDAIVQIDYCGIFWDVGVRSDMGNAVILDDHALSEFIAIIGRRRNENPAVSKNGCHDRIWGWM